MRGRGAGGGGRGGFGGALPWGKAWFSGSMATAAPAAPAIAAPFKNVRRLGFITPMTEAHGRQSRYSPPRRSVY